MVYWYIRNKCSLGTKVFVKKSDCPVVPAGETYFYSVASHLDQYEVHPKQQVRKIGRDYHILLDDTDWDYIGFDTTPPEEHERYRAEIIKEAIKDARKTERSILRAGFKEVKSLPRGLKMWWVRQQRLGSGTTAAPA